MARGSQAVQELDHPRKDPPTLTGAHFTSRALRQRSGSDDLADPSDFVKFFESQASTIREQLPTLDSMLDAKGKKAARDNASEAPHTRS